MKTRLFTLSCTILAAFALLGGAYHFVSAQERVNQQQVEKPGVANEKARMIQKSSTGITLPPCSTDCKKQILHVFIAGDQSNITSGDLADKTSPSSALQSYMNQYPVPPNREFDVEVINRVLGHTFTGLPANIIGATLEIHLKGKKNNDGLTLEFNGGSFAWGLRISGLPGAADNNQYNKIVLDLSALPTSSGGTINILPDIAKKLDVYVQDDTAVDYIILAVVVCGDKEEDGRWTKWLDRDNPSGKGDYETLSDLISEGLAQPNPGAIQCQTLAGIDWSQTGEVYTCTTAGGGRCVNADQPDGRCQDYQVRFRYP